MSSSEALVPPPFPPDGRAEGDPPPDWGGGNAGAWTVVARGKERRSGVPPVAASSRPRCLPVPRRAPRTQHWPPLPPSSSTWSYKVDSPPTSWTAVCQMGRPLDEASKLQFTPPSLSPQGTAVVRISAAEIVASSQRWTNMLVGYVLGDRPSYGRLKTCVSWLWSPAGSLEVHTRENGFFLFRFGSSEECDRVLQGGPWMFQGRLIILWRWTAQLGFDRDLLTSVPVWLRLPALPLKFWSAELIGKLASFVGVPLFLDRATMSCDRLGYARVFLELSAARSPPSFISVVLEGGEELQLPVEYEWVPPHCLKCTTFGHDTLQCPSPLSPVPTSSPAQPEAMDEERDGCPGLQSASAPSVVTSPSSPPVATGSMSLDPGPLFPPVPPADSFHGSADSPHPPAHLPDSLGMASDGLVDLDALPSACPWGGEGVRGGAEAGLDGHASDHAPVFPCPSQLDSLPPIVAVDNPEWAKKIASLRAQALHKKSLRIKKKNPSPANTRRNARLEEQGMSTLVPG